MARESPSIWLEKDLLEAVDERVRPSAPPRSPHNRSAVVSRMLGWVLALTELGHDLSEAQVRAVAGTLRSPDHLPPAQLVYVADFVAVSSHLELACAKEGVDAAELIRDLRSLSPGQCLALMDEVVHGVLRASAVATTRADLEDSDSPPGLPYS